jgi:xanthine dehydrogenase accessory factor
MSEIVDVLAAIERLKAEGQRMALATIVSVRGSTYRRPGARLLVPETGAPIGNISGGCLENDVADVARVVISEGTARMVSFDLTADDEAVWGWGLGCNGAIDLFVEPAEKAAETAGVLRIALEEQQPLAMVTVLDSSVPEVEWGARLLVRSGGSTEGTLGDTAVDAAAAVAAEELLDAERSEIRQLPAGAGEVRAFIEILEPPLRLVVLGAGHDAIPLVAVAATLGWQPIVADDRPQFLQTERFPGASGFVPLERPDQVGDRAPIDRRTFVVVMTHNFLKDKDYLRSLLSTEARYIAMLGPGARTKRLLDELREEGVMVAGADLDRLHGPAGLDLGAEAPEEIAAAITAEILAVKHGGRGGPLRDRAGPIHARPARAASGRT